METERRLEKASKQSIRSRIKYLKDIMDKKIPLEKGQMSWLDKPGPITSSIRDAGGDVQFMGKGNYGKVYRMCIDKLCKYEFVLKETYPELGFYPDDYPYTTENIEIKILKILNEFIYTGVTPHILLYLGDFDYAGRRYLLMEKADMTLKDLIGKYNNIETMRNIFFQFFYTLKVIHKKYPDFMHNDIKTSNIFLFKPTEETKGGVYKYTLNGKEYYIPNDYRIVLADFGLSSIVCKDCDNAMVENINSEQDVGIQTEQNQYKDVFRFFVEIAATKPQQEIKNFIGKYAKGERDDYNYLKGNSEPFTIDQILEDPFFDKYRQPVEGDKILEEFSDVYLEDPSMINFSTMSNLRKELVFNCDAYKDKGMAYADYKYNDKYNDPYRKTCSPGSKDKLDSISYTLSGEQFVTLGKMTEDQSEKISNIYKYLLEKYANAVNIPKKHFETVKLVVYRKAHFLVLGVHPKFEIEKTNIVTIDWIIQFNKFLCIEGKKLGI